MPQGTYSIVLRQSQRGACEVTYSWNREDSAFRLSGDGQTLSALKWKLAEKRVPSDAMDGQKKGGHLGEHSSRLARFTPQRLDLTIDWKQEQLPHMQFQRGLLAAGQTAMNMQRSQGNDGKAAYK